MNENITWLAILELQTLTEEVEDGEYTYKDGKYTYIVPGASECATTFSIKDAPIGMMIQPRSGYLHWTPASNQSGTHIVKIVREINGQINETEITFNVQVAAVTPPENSIYVAPDGKDQNSGKTIEEPLFSLQKAAKIANPGETIFLRGGIYQNDQFGEPFEDPYRKRKSLARIKGNSETESTCTSWTTIRPHGNEYVKLKSDVTGISFKDARCWRVQGIEIEGVTQKNENKSLSLWWDNHEALIEIKAWGISMIDSFHIEISDCIIHDFPGAGLANNGGANITVSNSVIYNNTWWSTDGSRGFANSKPKTENNISEYQMTMTGNLVFGNQSSIISNLFGSIDRTAVKLDIDEGNGLHMQNTLGNFFGAFLVENNLMIYNGKAGLGLNRIGNATILNNSFYQNAQAVERNGELSIQYPDPDSTLPNKIEKNLFHPLHDRKTIKSIGHDQTNPYPGIKDNFTIPGSDSDDIKDHVTVVDRVFIDPESLDFSPASPITSDYGVPKDDLERMTSKIKEYGLVIKPGIPEIDDEYLTTLKTTIFNTWPDPSENNEIPNELILKDPVTGYQYTYEQRKSYPGEPTA